MNARLLLREHELPTTLDWKSKGRQPPLREDCICARSYQACHGCIVRRDCPAAIPSRMRVVYVSACQAPPVSASPTNVPDPGSITLASAMLAAGLVNAPIRLNAWGEGTQPAKRDGEVGFVPISGEVGCPTVALYEVSFREAARRDRVFHLHESRALTRGSSSELDNLPARRIAFLRNVGEVLSRTHS